ncbi:MAG: hypothetical protein Q9169_006309, partial [Polycauliona sp. 2 TL-2023]
MGTRGLKVWRYRKRYFPFFNSHDSYPSNLGWSIVKSIPSDPDAYKIWLESQREMVEEWECRYEEYLSVPADIEQKSRKYYYGSDEPYDPDYVDEVPIDDNGEPLWRCPHFLDNLPGKGVWNLMEKNDEDYADDEEARDGEERDMSLLAKYAPSPAAPEVVADMEINQ